MQHNPAACIRAKDIGGQKNPVSVILHQMRSRNYAGGKMVWRYPSALGQMGNLEIDLNFMYRIPLWPVQLKSSSLVGTQGCNNYKMKYCEIICY
jgi:hypothetical protein